MNTFNVPKSLHEVFGEQQTFIEVMITLLFSLSGCLLIYFFLYPNKQGVPLVALIIGFILVWDVLAGCMANFTKGTNDYYAARPRSRWVFIAIHVHIIAIAWLLKGPIAASLLVWGVTIASGVLVNLLKGHRLQLFIAANLVCIDLLVIGVLEMPMWLTLVSVFFLVKVVLSFAVNHHYGY